MTALHIVSIRPLADCMVHGLAVPRRSPMGDNPNLRLAAANRKFAAFRRYQQPIAARQGVPRNFQPRPQAGSGSRVGVLNKATMVHEWEPGRRREYQARALADHRVGWRTPEIAVACVLSTYTGVKP